jgi:hypothetical protein
MTLQATTIRRSCLPHIALLSALLSLTLFLLTQPSSSVSAAPAPLSVEEMSELSVRAADAQHPSFAQAPRYQIEVALDLDLRVYEGVMTLSLNHQEAQALKELNFLLYPNSADLSGPQERRLIITHASFNGAPLAFDTLAGEVLSLPLPAPLQPNTPAEVRLGFKGSLYTLKESQLDPTKLDPKKLGLEQLLGALNHGHGAQGKKKEPQGGYGVLSYAEGVASMALWHPILVAYDEEGWDITPTKGVGDRSYFDVAHYDVTLTTDEGVMVASTGVELSSERLAADPTRPHRGPQRRRRFVAAGAREFTLQASRDYIKSSASYGDVMVNSYALKGQRASAEAALREAVSALESFEQMFGPYPYKELDVAQAPLIGGAGGVEFPGLITIASFLYQHDQSDKGDQKSSLKISERFLSESRDFVIAHEVAHQWWSALVGSDSRTHPFVDEALANYSAAAHFQRTRGPQATRRQMDVMMRLNYHLARLTGVEDQPVDQPTSAFKDALSYGAIVYGKGALYFWRLRSALGVEALERALKRYVAAHRFGVAHTAQLLSALRAETQHKEGFDALTRRWLYERHGDEDIEGVSVYQSLKVLMGDAALAQLDPKLRRWATHRGVDALAELLEGSARGQLDHDNVDYDAIVSLFEDVLEEEPQVARWAKVLGRTLSNPNAKPADALRDVGRELSREDPRLGLAVEGMGLILEALSLPDPPREPAPAPSTPSQAPGETHKK